MAEQGDVRGDIAAALEGWMTPEQLSSLLNEILAVRKVAFAEFNCRGCNKRQKHQVEIPDAKAVVAAITDLANQGFGRPGQAEAGDQERIHFERVMIFTEPTGTPV